MLKQQCRHSDNSRYAFRQADMQAIEQKCIQMRRQQMHILQNRLAEQNGRTEWQDRMADRCEQMQMNAQPDCQIARYADGSICKTTRLPDALPDALPDERADQAEQQAGRPAEQMDMQNRCMNSRRS